MLFGDMDELSSQPFIEIPGGAGRMPFGDSEEEQECHEDYQNSEDDGDASDDTNPTNDTSSDTSLRSTISRQVWGDSDSVTQRSDNEPEPIAMEETSEKWLSDYPQLDIFFPETSTNEIHRCFRFAYRWSSELFNSPPVIHPTHAPAI
ncbi:hypothetical protein MRS44_012874 [Fusarium solani]|uniref:uncharacterized protein n=1 Tax=Fusarium solani TaxID=169388 RepID=UPI0032C3FD67|nr:hypothetical protein MRS44_012874 [Fusarium solani]